MNGYEGLKGSIRFFIPKILRCFGFDWKPAWIENGKEKGEPRRFPFFFQLYLFGQLSFRARNGLPDDLFRDPIRQNRQMRYSPAAPLIHPGF